MIEEFSQLENLMGNIQPRRLNNPLFFWLHIYVQSTNQSYSVLFEINEFFDMFSATHTMDGK